MLMNIFKSKDERVISQTQKIGSEGFTLVFCLLFISFIVKSIFLNIPLRENWTEYAIMTAGAIYIAVRHVLAGTFVVTGTGKNKTEKRIIMYIAVSIVAGLIAGFAMGIRNYFLYDFKASLIAIVAIPIFCITAPITFFLLFSLDKASEKRAEKMSGSDEEK